jgi:hypothetical protein
MATRYQTVSVDGLNIFALDTAADEAAFITRRFLNGLRRP